MRKSSIPRGSWLAVILWTGISCTLVAEDIAGDDGSGMPRLDESRYVELSDDLPADRALSLEDLRLLLQLTDVLLDKQHEESARELAARDLGFLGHNHAVPALLAAIRDETNPLDVRQKSVVALSRISDKQNVDFLIGTLNDPEVAGTAAEQLYKVTGRTIESAIETNQLDWRRWWHRHKHQIDLNRELAFGSW